MRPWWPYLASEWRTAFGVVCAVFWISESLIAQVMRAGNRDRTDDRGSSLWFVLALPISWLIALVSAGLPWGGFGSTPVFAVGLTLMVAGQLLRWWSVATLGRLFTINVAIRPGHQLIESGPYRHVRHPAYTAILLVHVGAALCLGNAVSAIALVLPILAVLLNRMRVEEDVLVSGLGQPYRDYMRRTRRLIPGLY
jgi:protein-S-isoprenylcysteine O-methyltransferase Ste14